MLCRKLEKLEQKRRVLVFVSDGLMFQLPLQQDLQEL